ncbi:hypothetical protein ACM16X_14540 [Haloarcula japonica]|uniref:hypothetical protein n=1 Tax=Haloarcula japonica TaxID=29282 RepID=UPI0039F73A3C
MKQQQRQRQNENQNLREGHYDVFPSDGTISPTQVSRNRRQSAWRDTDALTAKDRYNEAAPLAHESASTNPDTYTAWSDYCVNESKSRRLWKTQVGIRDFVRDTHSRTRTTEDALAARTVCAQLGVPDHITEMTVHRCLSIDMRSFSSHYRGIYGAAIGFAMLHLFEDIDDAKESAYTDTAEDIFDGITVESLIELTFRKYGDCHE